MKPATAEMTLARCRRLAEALNSEAPIRRQHLAQELADLVRLLDAHAATDPQARTWLEGEAARVRDSVLTSEVRRTAPAWAGPLLLPPDLVEAMSRADEYA